MGLVFLVISHVQRSIRATWHMEFANKILHSQVKLMSHSGEASVKRKRDICVFCPIITPLDYVIFSKIY